MHLALASEQEYFVLYLEEGCSSYPLVFFFDHPSYELFLTHQTMLQNCNETKTHVKLELPHVFKELIKRMMKSSKYIMT
ncbi:hypothetical protein HanPI659440_Chr17g0701991 [Helianthus annuus]|nr:hypothetical protein HanPI659440_Chr17g0701991 [Helianthus annuus]